MSLARRLAPESQPDPESSEDAAMLPSANKRALPRSSDSRVFGTRTILIFDSCASQACIFRNRSCSLHEP